MTKIEDAACAAQVVTIKGIPQPLAEILSDGTGPSTGIAFIDKEKIYYLTLNTSNLSSTITHLIDTITQTVGAISALDAIIIGGPVCTAFIAQLNAIKALLTTLKATLK